MPRIPWACSNALMEFETMNKLTRDDLYSLEQYAAVRKEFRDKVIAHKRDRRVELGTNAALYFEDRLTMQYQVQEMLRIERIFEAEGINEDRTARLFIVFEGRVASFRKPLPAGPLFPSLRLGKSVGSWPAILRISFVQGGREHTSYRAVRNSLPGTLQPLSLKGIHSLSPGLSRRRNPGMGPQRHAGTL